MDWVLSMDRVVGEMQERVAGTHSPHNPSTQDSAIILYPITSHCHPLTVLHLPFIYSTRQIILCTLSVLHFILLCLCCCVPHWGNHGGEMRIVSERTDRRTTDVCWGLCALSQPWPSSLCSIWTFNIDIWYLSRFILSLLKLYITKDNNN